MLEFTTIHSQKKPLTKERNTSLYFRPPHAVGTVNLWAVSTEWKILARPLCKTFSLDCWIMPAGAPNCLKELIMPLNSFLLCAEKADISEKTLNENLLEV